MRSTAVLQEIRKRRYEEAYTGWPAGRLLPEEAARLVGVCERTVRRYIDRSEEAGLEGLSEKRLSQILHRRAPVAEVRRLTEPYRSRHGGWSAKHCYAGYRRAGGTRRYTWVKSRWQEGGLIRQAKGHGKHRKRRERAPWPGMRWHQDGSTHDGVPGVQGDLIVTMDDATNAHYSMGCVEEDGTTASFWGVREGIEARGRCSSRYPDRGSQYWLTPEAGGHGDPQHPTPLGRAMRPLGMEMIPAYSPAARGRSERRFRTPQDRLPKAVAATGITDMAAANRYLKDLDRPAFNSEFRQPAMEAGSACVPSLGARLEAILGEPHERVVGQDHGVAFEGLKRQIPADRARYHEVTVKGRVHRYLEGRRAVLHGPRCRAR